MSKKTHRMAELKEQEKARRTPVVSQRPARSKPAASKSAAPTPQAARAAVSAAGKNSARASKVGRPAAGASVYDRGAVKGGAINATSVRISGGALAVLALLGGLFLMQSANGNYTPLIIAGTILLGVLAGLGVFSAVRAQDVASRMRAQRRG